MLSFCNGILHCVLSFNLKSANLILHPAFTNNGKHSVSKNARQMDFVVFILLFMSDMVLIFYRYAWELIYDFFRGNRFVICILQN